MLLSGRAENAHQLIVIPTENLKKKTFKTRFSSSEINNVNLNVRNNNLVQMQIGLVIGKPPDGLSRRVYLNILKGGQPSHVFKIQISHLLVSAHWTSFWVTY